MCIRDSIYIAHTLESEWQLAYRQWTSIPSGSQFTDKEIRWTGDFFPVCTRCLDDTVSFTTVSTMHQAGRKRAPVNLRGSHLDDPTNRFQKQVHRYKMDSVTPASTWMQSPPRQPATTLTLDLQNLIRSPVGGHEYSLYVSLGLLKLLRRIVVTRSLRTNEQPENIIPSPTLSGGKGILSIHVYVCVWECMYVIYIFQHQQP